MARIALFIVFFWFGALKVLGLSPAQGMVEALFEHTIPFMSFGMFMILFGIYEMVIGLLFLKRNLERLVMPLLLVHMTTTFLPLIVLRDLTWSGFLVPTMEGQYIIKNVVIIATAFIIAAHMHPLKK